MPREHLEVVLRAYELIRRKELDAFLELMHPDVEGVSRVMEAEGTVYRGREGMRRFLDDLWAVFPEWEPQVISSQEIGDGLVVELRISGHAGASGIDVVDHAWQAIRFADGKPVWIHGFSTEAEAVAALETSG